MARQPRVDPAWHRLAGLLVNRRIALDPRYRNRQTFCATKQIDYRVISDIENARRDNFSGPMITAIENAYELADGAIHQALADPHATSLRPRDTPPAPPTTPPAQIPMHLGLSDLADWEQHIWMTPGLTVEQRETAILIVRLQRGDLDDDTHSLLRLYQALGRVVDRHLDNGNSRNSPQAI